MVREKASGAWRAVLKALARISFAVRHSLPVLAVLFFSASAFAQVQLAKIPARPALWTAHGAHATVYLFGSIHLLPANVDWHTPKIDAAMAAADTFYFEAPLGEQGKAEVADFIRKNGSLPAGETLRARLPKSVLADYEHALALAHLEPEMLDGDRPWLAGIVVEVAYLQQMHYLVADGVDQQVFAYATAHNMPVRAFETPEQQLSLFTPKDPKLELDEFDAGLKEFQTEESMIGAIVDAWGAGDVKTVGRLVNDAMDKDPGVRKMLIDDRNKAWIATLDTMLKGTGTYFVTVGTGHLVGPKGVPALLRKQGCRVEGP